MHIEEIVLDNFKSFGRTTRIPFYEDFTTISGPNGAGKSNIIDAILFALGLARSRGMRAEKLTDLIYNPSHADDDAAGGPREASVEVVLNNEDRTVERSQVVSAADSEDIGDVDRISVKRRVKRTDENYYSYYYLNGRSVNLSDIQELLSAAGIAPEGYNVVMQGDVTGVINMTPRERREIIDEIAGVAEFDAKKEDAYEELEVVEQRVEEADLRIEEKEARLDQLEEERETALEYQKLKERKAEYEGYRRAAKLAETREQLATTEAEIEETESDLADARATLDERRGRVDRLEEAIEDLDAEIERTGEDEQLRIKGEIEEIKGEISGLEDRIEGAEERIEEAEARRRQAFVEIDRKEERVDELDEEIRETKVRRASVQADIEQKEAELAEVREEIEAIDTEYDELKAKLQEKKAAIEEARAERNELQREQDRLLDEARRRSEELEAAREDLTEAEKRLPEVDARLSDLGDEREKAKRNVDNIDEVVADLREEKQAVQAEIDDIEEELSAAQQEYAELEATAEQSGDSSFGRAVSTVLNADLEGVHGAVAQLGSVPEEYATACETAGGGRLANVVVDDDGVGQEAIELLKRRNAGRATFLPLPEMDDRRLPSLPDHPGVIDFAYDLVDFDDQYAGVFSHVLGDTVVVEDIETARELMGNYRLVTLSGDLVEKSGAMTGGSRSGSRYSFTGSEGRLQRVAERVTELEEKRAERRETLRGVEQRLEDARDRQADAADQLRAIDAEIDDAEAERADIKERIEELEDRIEELEAERESVDEEMQSVEEKIDAKELEIDEIQSEIDDIEDELADSRVPQLSERADEIAAEIDDLEERADDLEGERESLELEREYAEEAIEELHEEVETAQNTKAEQEQRIEELEGEIESKEEALAEKEERIDELEAELAELKAERERRREELAEARETREAAAERVSRLENRRESLAERRGELREAVERAEAELEDVDEDEIPDIDEVEATIEEVEGRMEELEPVNMLAIEEYDEVEADLEGLVEKRETLEEERAGIVERIESYETQKRETFMDSFAAIDGHFQRIFERLSDGTGELHLENEAEPFEGGLTMKAQPGDKPIQRLDAMSGGEKSLTALAFIFALQRHNPAPFYALDEIDAFLDAANADRVGEMVDELAAEAQFVVVSHRSAMLERSERAIGVTMQEDNVSAVTGIDLAGGEAGVTADD